MKKRQKHTIAVVKAKTTIDALKNKAPPNLYLDKALKELGPDIRREMKKGWTDEDIIAAFSGQDPNAIRELLEALRTREDATRRARKQAKAQAKVQESGNAARQPVPRGPSVPLLPGGNALAQTTPPRLPAPKLMLSGPAAGGTHHVTRNRGIRRPAPKDLTDG